MSNPVFLSEFVQLKYFKYAKTLTETHWLSYIIPELALLGQDN